MTRTVAIPNSRRRRCCQCLRIIPTPPSVTVHFLHDNTLTPNDRDKFSYIAGRYGQVVKFYNVEELCAAEMKRITELFKNHPTFKKFSIGSFCRLFTPKILSDEIDQVIYFDSDIAVNVDVSEIWQIPLGDKPLAAVADI